MQGRLLALLLPMAAGVVFILTIGIVVWSMHRAQAAAVDGQTLADQSPDVQAAYAAIHGERAAHVWDRDHEREIGREPAPCDHVVYEGSLVAVDGTSLATEPAAIQAAFTHYWGHLYAPSRWTWERNCLLVATGPTPTPAPVDPDVHNHGGPNGMHSHPHDGMHSHGPRPRPNTRRSSDVTPPQDSQTRDAPVVPTPTSIAAPTAAPTATPSPTPPPADDEDLVLPRLGTIEAAADFCSRIYHGSTADWQTCVNRVFDPEAPPPPPTPTPSTDPVLIPTPTPTPDPTPTPNPTRPPAPRLPMTQAEAQPRDGETRVAWRTRISVYDCQQYSGKPSWLECTHPNKGPWHEHTAERWVHRHGSRDGAHGDTPSIPARQP